MRPPIITVKIARDAETIADAQRVRNRVFVIEEDLLRCGSTSLGRETDMYDDLATTVHFVAYAGGVPAATVRLLRPNPDVARVIGQPLGIDLASRYDLGAFLTAGVSPAEVSRLCVVPEHRGTAALRELYLAMYGESTRAGISHWVAGANAETDCLEDAEIAHRIAERDGLVSRKWHVAPWPAPLSRHPSTRPLYTPAERARAQAGYLEGLRLPRVLSIFAKLAGRYMGRPSRERGYTVCSLPLVVELSDVAGTAAFRRSFGRS